MILDFVLLGLLTIFALPLAVFQIAKFITYGILKGQEAFQKDLNETNSTYQVRNVFPNGFVKKDK